MSKCLVGIDTSISFGLFNLGVRFVLFLIILLVVRLDNLKVDRYSFYDVTSKDLHPIKLPGKSSKVSTRE